MAVNTPGRSFVMCGHRYRYGGRGFTCRDLEGRLWSIGTYDPWWPPLRAGEHGRAG